MAYQVTSSSTQAGASVMAEGCQSFPQNVKDGYVNKFGLVFSIYDVKGVSNRKSGDGLKFGTLVACKGKWVNALCTICPLKHRSCRTCAYDRLNPAYCRLCHMVYQEMEHHNVPGEDADLLRQLKTCEFRCNQCQKNELSFHKMELHTCPQQPPVTEENEPELKALLDWTVAISLWMKSLPRGTSPESAARSYNTQGHNTGMLDKPDFRASIYRATSPLILDYYEQVKGDEAYSCPEEKLIFLALHQHIAAIYPELEQRPDEVCYPTEAFTRVAVEAALPPASKKMKTDKTTRKPGSSKTVRWGGTQSSAPPAEHQVPPAGVVSQAWSVLGSLWSGVQYFISTPEAAGEAQKDKDKDKE